MENLKEKYFINKNITIKELNSLFNNFTLDKQIILKLEYINGIKFPKRIKKGILLKNTKVIENSYFKYIDGGIIANDVKIIKNVSFGENTIGDISLLNVEELYNVNFPKEIRKGSLLLPNLKVAVNVNFPKLVRKNFDISNLTTIKNVKFPNFIGGEYYLNEEKIKIKK